MNSVLDSKSAMFIKSLPPDRLNAWVTSVYKSGFKDGIEKAEQDFDKDAEIMTTDKVLEKLTRSGFSSEEANYILDVLLS